LVDIYSIAGKMVRSSNEMVMNNQIRIKQLDNLPKGLYFVSLELDGQRHNSKFLKN
jgi:hypothetical protein